MRRTKEEAEQTRQALLEAAEQVFSHQGFAATRLSDIAKAANVTRGAIYHHFGNKMELFVALHKERVDPYFKLVQTIFQSDLSPREKIKTMLSEFIKNAAKDINFAARQRFNVLRDMEFSDCDELHGFMHEQGQKFYEGLVSVLKEGQARGDIRADIKAELAALNLLAYVKGLISLMIMDSETNDMDLYDEEMIETALKGF